jgi:hypothetical protein
MLHMPLGFAIVGPEVLCQAFSFQNSDILFFASQVKDAPLFHGHVFAGVRFDCLVHSYRAL